MKFEEIEFEGVIESHLKIFKYLAIKYLASFKNYELEDLMHEQMIACYNALNKYDSKHKIGTFLYTVSENRLKSLYRSEMRLKRKPKHLYYLESTRIEEAGLILNEASFDVENSYYISEIRENADAVASEVLSDFEYQLYYKIVYENKSTAQIALELDKSEKQICNGITRMRSKMREKRDSIAKDLWYN